MYPLKTVLILMEQVSLMRIKNRFMPAFLSGHFFWIFFAIKNLGL